MQYLLPITSLMCSFSVLLTSISLFFQHALSILYLNDHFLSEYHIYLIFSFFTLFSILSTYWNLKKSIPSRLPAFVLPLEFHIHSIDWTAPDLKKKLHTSSTSRIMILPFITILRAPMTYWIHNAYKSYLNSVILTTVIVFIKYFRFWTRNIFPTFSHTVYSTVFHIPTHLHWIQPHTLLAILNFIHIPLDHFSLSHSSLSDSLIIWIFFLLFY